VWRTRSLSFCEDADEIIKKKKKKKKKKTDVP